MKLYFKNKNSQCQTSPKGFTLVETLVALSILLVAIAAVFSVAQIGLGSLSTVRNRITGMYLAEEAMDGVKNIKDSNLLAGVDWLTGLKACATGSPCGYDILSPNGGAALENLSDFEVKIDSKGLYHQMDNNNGTPTGFVRKVYVDEIVPDKEARVHVVVTMPNGRFTTFEITEYIYKFF